MAYSHNHKLCMHLAITEYTGVCTGEFKLVNIDQSCTDFIGAANSCVALKMNEKPINYVAEFSKQYKTKQASHQDQTGRDIFHHFLNQLLQSAHHGHLQAPSAETYSHL